MVNAKDRIIVPLDVNTPAAVRDLVHLLKDDVGMFKVGLELIHSLGPQVVDMILDLGGQVMYDPKLADIPTTVGKAMHCIAARNVKLCTVFVPSSLDSITVAVQNRGDVQVIGVTALTTMDDDACGASYNMTAIQSVLRFADQAKLAGCQGIVCSPQELAMIRSSPTLKDLLLITPGVRPKWASANDQKRIMTHDEAIRDGADYLVIGRPITSPPANIGSPVAAAQLIASEMQVVFNQRARSATKGVQP